MGANIFKLLTTMTKDELKKYKRELPLTVKAMFPNTDITDHREDEYGVYETGFFVYKKKEVYISVDGGKWHLSVSANHTLGYYELKEIRYKFMPNDMHVAQVFPPREEFVNLMENCFHLYELIQNEL